MPGHLIRRFHQATVAILQKEVSVLGYDLTPVQYAVLNKINNNPGIDQITLAGLIAYDRTTITSVVDRLEQRGWVTREVSNQDRRSKVIKLTTEGVKVLCKVTPAVISAQAIMLQGLEAKESEVFLSLLEKATDAVNELSRAPLKKSKDDKN